MFSCFMFLGFFPPSLHAPFVFLAQGTAERWRIPFTLCASEVVTDLSSRVWCRRSELLRGLVGSLCLVWLVFFPLFRSLRCLDAWAAASVTRVFAPVVGFLWGFAISHVCLLRLPGGSFTAVEYFPAVRSCTSRGHRKGSFVCPEVLLVANAEGFVNLSAYDYACLYFQVVAGDRARGWPFFRLSEFWGGVDYYCIWLRS